MTASEGTPKAAVSRYRMREVISVDAIEWTGNNEDDVREFVGMVNASTLGTIRNWDEPGFMVVRSTVDEQFIAQLWNARACTWLPVPVGSMVIRGPIGTWDGCFSLPSGVFATHYEPAPEESSNADV